MPEWLDAEVEALEARTTARRGERDIVLFYGSSTFTDWQDLEHSLTGVNAVNHGFGGSTMADCIDYFDRLVTPMSPRALVLSAGDGDLVGGATPELVRERVEFLLLRKRATLGPIPMIFVSINISPALSHIMQKIGYTNRIIERSLFSRGDIQYLDINRRMIGRGIGGMRACYTEDSQQLNAQGYAIWQASLEEALNGLMGTDGLATV